MQTIVVTTTSQDIHNTKLRCKIHPQECVKTKILSLILSFVQLNIHGDKLNIFQQDALITQFSY